MRGSKPDLQPKRIGQYLKMTIKGPRGSEGVEQVVDIMS
jgi:hypothetical protein